MAHNNSIQRFSHRQLTNQLLSNCLCWGYNVIISTQFTNNGRCFQSHQLATAVVLLPISLSLPSNTSICHNIFISYVNFRIFYYSFLSVPFSSVLSSRLPLPSHLSFILWQFRYRTVHAAIIKNTFKYWLQYVICYFNVSESHTSSGLATVT
jgi:hypothetical protein